MAWRTDVGRFLRRLSRGIVAYDKAFLFERDLSHPLEKRAPSIPMEIRRATPQDIDSLTLEQHGYGEAEMERAKRRLEEGQLCVVAVHQGRIIYFNWVSFKAFAYSGITLPLGPGWAYGYDARTVEKYRGKGLHSAAVSYQWSAAREAGAKRAITWVDVRNDVNLRYVRKTCAQKIGRAWTVLLLRRWRFTWTPRWLAAYLLRSSS